MTAHSFRAQAVRWLLAFTVACSPLAGPGASWLLALFAASVLAYDGPTDATVYGMLALLFGAELVYGIPLGVLSLAFLVAVVGFVGAGRFISLTPWASQDGWGISDMVRVFLVAVAAFIVMTVSGVGIGWLIYGNSELLLRLRTLPLPPPVWLGGALVMVLITLRRADVPFRRRVLFGA